MGGFRNILFVCLVSAFCWTGLAHAAEIVRPKIVLQADHGTSPTALAWTPDARYLLTGGANHHVLIWDRSTGDIVDNLRVPLDFDGLDLCWYPGHYIINKIAVSPDGKFFFADVRWGNRYGAQAEQRVAVFDMYTRKLVALKPFEGIAWLPDSRRIVVREPARWSLDVGAATVRDLRTATCENRSKAPVSLSAGVARIYDTATDILGPSLARGLPDNAPIRLSPDGGVLVTLRSIDLDARLASGCRDVRVAEQCRTPGRPREPTSDRIATERDTLIITPLEGAGPRRTLTPDGSQIVGTMVSPDGRRVYAMTRAGAIYRYGAAAADDLPPIPLAAWLGHADQGPWLSADGANLLFQMKREEGETRTSADGERVQGWNGNYVVLIDAKSGVERARSPGQTLGVDAGQAVVFQGFDSDTSHRWPSVRMDLASGAMSAIGPQFHVPSAVSSDGKSVALIQQVDPNTGVPSAEAGANGVLRIVDFAAADKPRILSGVISTFTVDARVSSNGARVWANHLRVKQSYLNYLKDIDDGRDLPVETLAFNLSEGRFEPADDDEAKLKKSYRYEAAVAAETSPDRRLTVRYLNSTSVAKVVDHRQPDAEPWSVEGLTGSVLRVGFLAGKPVMWIAMTDGAIGFWSTRDHREILELYLLPGSHFFALTPDGRYDSDLGPDAKDLRWLMSDQPFQSLAPQTFMRQFYQPKLVGLVFYCLGREKTETCEKRFRPVPDLAALDRVLPETRIASVTAAPDARSAEVVVEARDAPGKKSATAGVYDLRIFRNSQLVAQTPGAPALSSPSADAWRANNLVRDAPSGDGWIRKSFKVALPTSDTATTATFSAYAFNADRVKGETASATLPIVANKRSRARAYVIAIGVDKNGEADWRLHFAAADAKAISAALGAIPHRDVTPLAMTSVEGHQLATRDNIHDVLRVLSDGDPSARNRLIKAGIAAQSLAAATPDDLLILTFSGHGWADDSGAFYLVPAGGRRLKASNAPDPSSFISALDLTEWLRKVDAGETVFIIDACHSAASVDAGDFKPGPMGDPGLGQLAFDKGIRILAAAQANEEAQEDPKLGQGLLTYSLVNDGLLARRTAELRLDAWLQESAARLPSVRPPAPRPSRIISALDDDEGGVQRPALFDFTGKPSAVLLRAAPPAPRPRPLQHKSQPVGRADRTRLDDYRSLSVPGVWRFGGIKLSFVGGRVGDPSVR